MSRRRVSAGQLDQRLMVERRSYVADGGGGSTVSWLSLGSVWGKAEARSSRETTTEGRMTASFSVRFTIYDMEIHETDRIIWRGEAYNINGVMREGGRRGKLRIDATRGGMD